MPKRKAADESEPVASIKKKSKKERLAEARARAQEWANGEQVKKQSNTAATVAAAQSPAPKAKNISAKRSATKKTPMPQKTDEKAKKSKAAKIAEARANAKAWAAAEEAKSVSKKSGVKASVEVEELKVVRQPVIAAPQQPRAKPATKVQPIPCDNTGSANKVDIGINHVPYDTKEVTVGATYKDCIPDSNTDTAINPIPFDTKEVNVETIEGNSKPSNNQPQSLLESSGITKHQSLLKKSGMLKKHDSPVAPFYEGASVTEDDVVKEETDLSKPKRPFLTGMLIFFIALGILFPLAFYVFREELDSLSKEFTKTLPKNLHNMVPKQAMTVMQSIVSKEQHANPCYIDDYEFSEEEKKVKQKTASFCDKSLDRIPCPDQGLCADGVLHVCLDANKTPSVDGSECVWDNKAKESFAATEALLTNWTIQNYCKLSGAKFAQKSRSKAVVFPLTKVQEEVEVIQEMISESKDFIFEENNDELVIGFSDSYVDSKFVLPSSCWITLAILEMINFFAGSTLRAFVNIFSWAFEFAYAYPIIALSSILFIMTALYIQRRRKEQKELAENVVLVRDMAFQHMSANTSAHVVLHLRDAIAMEMHPMSRKGRSYIILKVWPRVVADIRHDNRVLKTNRQVEGKPRDVWQWVASTPAK